MLNESDIGSSVSLLELSTTVGGAIKGNPETRVSTFATLKNAGPDAVSFLSNSHYKRYLQRTRAGIVIVGEEFADECPVPALVTERPYVAYARAAQMLTPAHPVDAGVHAGAVVDSSSYVDSSAEIAPGAVVERDAHVGACSVIGPSCVVKRGAWIGEGVRLSANVSICGNVVVGARSLLHPGVVIGGDGFGIADDDGEWIKVPQVGAVDIGADVEIGANTTIDRGAIENTVIEDGVKIDNLVQIGHNVRIGAHSALAGCCGISGSAVIGRHCILGGRVGVVGHIEVADNCVVLGATVVSHSITEPGVYSGSMPMDTAKQWRRNSVRIRQLDKMAHRIRALEKKLKEKGE